MEQSQTESGMSGSTGKDFFSLATGVDASSTLSQSDIWLMLLEVDLVSGSGSAFEGSLFQNLVWLESFLICSLSVSPLSLLFV